MKKCNDNLFQNKVCVLVSKKRCVITENSILIKKGVSKKNAIIKIGGIIVPKNINTNLYNFLYVNEKDVEHITFFN